MIGIRTEPALRAVAKWVAIPLLGSVAGLAASAAATALIAPTYQATASVIIMPAAPADSGAVKGVDVSLAQNLAPSIARLVESREVSLEAASTLGLPENQVAGHITATYELGIQIVTIATTAPTAAGAAAMANAATEAVRKLCTRLRLGGESAISVQTLDLAGVPGQPIAPKPLLNYTLGAVVGLLAGLGFASLRTRVDDRFRRVADIEAELGLPALGTLRRAPRRIIHSGQKPVTGRSRDRHPQAQDLYRRSGVSGAVDAMVAALSVLSAQRPRLRIVVTSVADDGGAAFVAALLALGLRRHHDRTILVAGRSRRSGFDRYFPRQSAQTVEEILASRRRPAAGATEESFMDSVSVVGVDAVVRHLGTQAPRDEQVGGLVDTLAGHGDPVVVEAPPVLSGSGLAALARHADVVLLVVASDRVRKTEAGRAAVLVQRLGVPLAGLVVVGAAAGEHGWRSTAWPAVASPAVRPDRIVPPQAVSRSDAGMSVHTGTNQGAP
jgi:capsular polysaccharide biosynthesis protein/Mrp family chromosome partitioning ATPase